MGWFDAMKRSFGMVAADLELRVQPETLHVDGEVGGELMVRALKPLKVYSVGMELVHGFPDEWEGAREEVVEAHTLAERISLEPHQITTLPFYIDLPAQIAPSVGQFRWELRVGVATQDHGQITKRQPLKVRLSPVMSAVVEAIKRQFGFRFEEAGADEDGIWMTFEPTGSVKQHFHHLEIAFDEQADEITLWVALREFRPKVIQRYEEAWDPHERSIELVIDKPHYMVGPTVDRDGITGLLAPLFAL